MAYGTSIFNDAASLPSKVMVKVGYTPPTPEQPVGPYRKFAPNELKFDREENGERFCPSINGHGFRGEDFAVTKEPGVVRVVTLGGSSTFGYHDRNDQTYPYYLEEILNAEGGDLRFEVINLGIPHIDSGQVVSLFLAEALPLEPDILTIYAVGNDSGGLRQILKHRNERPPVYDFFRSRVSNFRSVEDRCSQPERVNEAEWWEAQ